MSFTCVLTEDAIDEVKNLLNKREYYVAVNGKMAFSAKNDIINIVLDCMTG